MLLFRWRWHSIVWQFVKWLTEYLLHNMGIAILDTQIKTCDIIWCYILCPVLNLLGTKLPSFSINWILWEVQVQSREGCVYEIYCLLYASWIVWYKWDITLWYIYQTMLCHLRCFNLISVQYQELGMVDCMVSKARLYLWAVDNYLFIIHFRSSILERCYFVSFMKYFLWSISYVML